MVTSNAIVYSRPANESLDFGHRGKFDSELTLFTGRLLLRPAETCLWYRSNLPAGLAGQTRLVNIGSQALIIGIRFALFFGSGI